MTDYEYVSADSDPAHKRINYSFHFRLTSVFLIT